MMHEYLNHDGPPADSDIKYSAFLMYVIFICSAKQEKACWPILRSFYLWDETTHIVTRCACVTLKAWTSFPLWKVTVKRTRFYL